LLLGDAAECGNKAGADNRNGDGRKPNVTGNPADSGNTQAVGSRDPNEKTGPAGYGTGGYVQGDQVFAYRVDFENDSKATAPAQRVDVTDQLSANLDWSTFQFTEFGFGDKMIAVPADSQYFRTTVPMNHNNKAFEVDVELAFHSQTGEIDVAFQSYDPATSLPPDVLTGFLPPEDGTGRGMGYFNYTIDPKSGLASGTEIRNIAIIQFDFGEIIATNQVDPHDPTKGTDPAKEALVTIDTGIPTDASHVDALPATTTTLDFPVTWTGQDDAGGSGIGGYDIYVSDNGGAPYLWQQGTVETSATFPGREHHIYTFYSVATDNVDHREANPLTPDAETMVNVSAATVVTLPDGGGTFEVLLSGTDFVLQRQSGANVWTQPVGSFASLAIFGSAADDSLVIDFANGNPIPAGVMSFNGMSQGAGGDRLTLINGSFTSVAYSFANANDGSITVAGSTLNFMGLEPITDNLSAVDRVFTFSGAEDQITLSDDNTPGDGVSRIVAPGSAETVDFTNPTGSLTINGGGGNDIVDLSAVDSPFSATITVNGDDGHDNVDASALALAVTLSGGLGYNSLIGSSGNDTFVQDGYSSLEPNVTNWDKLQGGLGDDALILNAGDLTLDLTTLPDDWVIDIETIDLTGSGDNTLTVNSAEVLGISTHSDTLIVRGNAGDTVNIGSGWTQQADEVIGTDTFNVFTQGTATVKAQEMPAATWQNPNGQFDVDGDGDVIALDVLTLINHINSHPGDTSLPAPPAAPPPYHDVNDDGDCTALDVLQLINHINGPPAGEGEAAAELGMVAEIGFWDGQTIELRRVRLQPASTPWCAASTAELGECPWHAASQELRRVRPGGNTTDSYSVRPIPDLREIAQAGRTPRELAPPDAALAELDSILPDIMKDIDSTWRDLGQV